MTRIAVFDEHTLEPLLCGYEPLARVRNQWNFDHLAAPYWRLYWCDKPGASVRQGDKVIPLNPDVMVLVPPNTDYSTRYDKKRRVNHLFIHFHMVLPIAAPAGDILVLAVEQPLPELTARVQRSLAEAGPGNWELSFAVRALLNWVLGVVGPGRLTGKPPDPRILNVVRYIEEHLPERYSATVLAQQAGLSGSALSALFHEQLGMTIRDYIRVQRIERACRMLHMSDASIDAIAESVGFCDRHYFSRVFSAVRGMGPAQFRRSNALTGDTPASLSLHASKHSMEHSTHARKSPYHSDT